MSTLNHGNLCTNHPEDITRMGKLLIKWGTQCQEVLNKNLIHSVACGHDLCVAYFFSLGATGNIDDLMKVAVRKGFSKVFNVLIERSDQNNVNKILSHITDDTLRVDAGEGFKIMTSIIDHGFDIQPLVYIISNHNFNSNLVKKYAAVPKQLKYLVLKGSCAVDHYQLPTFNLTRQQKEELSVVRHLMNELKSFNRAAEDLIVSLKTTKEVLYILHQCGANFWCTDGAVKSPVQIVDSIISHWKEDIMFDCPPSDELIAVCGELKLYIDELMSKPLTLQSLCRLHLLQQFKRRYSKVVEELESMLPREIIFFLQGGDMKVTVIEFTGGFNNYVKWKRVHEYFCELQSTLNKRDNMPLEFSNAMRQQCIDAQRADEVPTMEEKYKNLQIVGRRVLDVMYGVAENEHT